MIVFIIWVAQNWSEINGYIRYDKYPIYIDWFRFTFLFVVVGGGAYLFDRLVIPLGIGVLLPSNLFFALFIFLVLPGVVLTSDYGVIGTASFYGYLAAFVFYVAGSAASSVFLKFSPVREINLYQVGIITTYRVTGVTYLLMLGMFSSALIVAYASTDMGLGILQLAFEFMASGDMPAGARQVADERIGVYSALEYRSIFSVMSAYATGLVMPLAVGFILLNGVVRRNALETMLGVMLVVVTLFILISSGSRLRGLFYLLFVFTMLSHVKKVRLSNIAVWGAFIFGLLIVQTIVLGRMVGGGGYLQNLVMSINRVIERVFLVKGYVTQQVFHYIPWVSDYKAGGTYAETLLGLNTNEITFAEEMSHYIYGPAGTAGPQAFAEGYANYGMLGMLIIAMVMGVLIQSITVALVRQKSRDILSLVFQAFVIVLIARTGYGSLFTFKANGMHVLLILWGVVVVLRKVFSICIDSKPGVSRNIKDAGGHNAT
ncbi:oligosaccharide repeat unit polymerase [Pseudomonadota bacterium]